MERIFIELSNPVWWFSVVLAGIAINILSSYLKSALDKFFSKSSSWWRNRSESRRKAWEERVDRIASSSWDREQAIADDLRMRLTAIFIMLLAAILLLLVLYMPSSVLHFYVRQLLLVLCGISCPLGFLEWMLAEDIEAVLKEAEGRLSRQTIKEDTDV